MRAPLFPSPALITNPAGVEFAEPIATPESASDESNVCPLPAAVNVRLPFVVVANAAADPPPIVSVVADIPSVEADVIVANDDAVNVVVPDNVVVVFVNVVV